MAQVNRFRDGIGWRAIASGFGLGYSPVAPGTLGSLLALPLWYWGDGGGAIHYAALAAVVAAAVPAARAEMRATGRKDPPSAVIDETAGMLLAATGVPWAWKSAILLFFLFRLIDVLKWGPVAWLDSKEGAWYVVADDLAAGILANAAFRVVTWLSA